MKWALIGVPGIVLAGAYVSGSAQALPVVPRVEAVAAAQSPLLLSVRYYRHHWHYRHYGYWRHGRSRWARDGAPEQAGSGAVKPGRWEFVAQLQTPATSQLTAETQLPLGAEPQSGGGIKTSYFGCVTSDKAVPVEFGPQCKLNSSERNGPTLTWSMTCTNAQDTVRSDGVAQYSGDTMEATMVSHLPGGNGKVTDMTQHITGRYHGTCTQPRE